MFKSQAKILNIEKACNLTDKAFNYILGKIKEGISEKELALKIEFFIKRHGSDIAFPPIVAFGKNSSFPHHVPTFNSQLSTLNSIVLLDFGAKLNGYCSDMTRTVFFGKPTTEQKRMYQTVLKAQQKAIEYIVTHLEGGSPKRSEGHDSFEVDSIKASEVDKIARDYIVSQGFPTIPHSLGHGIGRKVHEPPKLSPKSKDTLKPGMVFTIEPGIYLPGFGGVRIEDVVLLEKPYRILTKSSHWLNIL